MKETEIVLSRSEIFLVFLIGLICGMVLSILAFFIGFKNGYNDEMNVLMKKNYHITNVNAHNL